MNYLKKLVGWLKSIVEKYGTDKVMHFLVSFIIAQNIATLFFLHVLDYRGFVTYFGAAFVGAFVSWIVGWTKEWVDNHTEGNCADGKDLLADICGAVSGAIIGVLVIL